MTKLKKYIKLILASVTIAAAFIGVLALGELKFFEEMRESNRKFGVDAGTLFYTETEQFNSADRYMQSSRVATKKSSKPDSVSRSK